MAEAPAVCAPPPSVRARRRPGTAETHPGGRAAAPGNCRPFVPRAARVPHSQKSFVAVVRRFTTLSTHPEAPRYSTMASLRLQAASGRVAAKAPVAKANKFMVWQPVNNKCALPPPAA
jgi:hypothetical protein